MPDTDTQHAVSWGVPDSTSPWRQSFASSNAPGWLIYFPVYRVIIDTPKVTYGPNILQQYSINVEEV